MPGLGREDPHRVIDFVKEYIDEDLEKGNINPKRNEYKKGDGNLLLIKSCGPTRTTKVSDRVTHALIDFLEKKAKGPDGQLVFPFDLYDFNHLGEVEKVINCS